MEYIEQNEWKTKPSDRFVLKWIKCNLSARITPRLVRVKWLRPWMITVSSASLGVLAGVVFAMGLGWLAGLVGGVSQILDGVDGQFARLTGRQGTAGAFWDSILDRYEAWSAGTEPSEVNSYAIKVMEEIGINISSHYAKSVGEFLEMEFDYVVTVCDHAKGICPFLPGGKEVFHKGFEGPAAFKGNEEEKAATFRRIRDEIKDWIEKTFGI